MSDHALAELIERARGAKMTEKQQEQQRLSFAYGNSKIENDRITRDSVHEALKRDHSDGPKKDEYS